jgi:hypothetical protein
MDFLTEGYHGKECRSEYGGAEQRWLVVIPRKTEAVGDLGYQGSVLTVPN